RLNNKTSKHLGMERCLPIILCLLYFITITNISVIPHASTIRYASIVVIGLFLISGFSYFIKRKNLILNIILIVYSILVMYTSYINKDLITERSIFPLSILYSTVFCEIFLVMEYVAEKNKFDLVINIFYKLTLIVMAVNDILLTISPTLFGVHLIGVYLVGNKFNVAYLHMVLLAFFIVRSHAKSYSKRRFYFFYIVYFIIAIIMGIKVDCNTGTIGVILFTVVYILLRKVQLTLKPWMVLTVLIISCMFAFTYEAILTNEHVQYFVSEVLGRSLTLTGRTNIYKAVPEMFKDHWTWGYGYGTAYIICDKYVGIYDTQNGLLEWILQIGWIATALMLVIIYISFSKLKMIDKKENLKEICPIIFLIYSFSVLASVEITITYRYFMLVALVYCKGIQAETYGN
ncbi:MAG: O-antigen ligase family protein, partial [bacterium]|nr:O-antigen ligase family protein [bacterium]